MEYGLLGVVPVINITRYGSMDKKMYFINDNGMPCWLYYSWRRRISYHLCRYDLCYRVRCGYSMDTSIVISYRSSGSSFGQKWRARSVIKLAAKKVKSEKSLFLWSWLLAAVLFIEDMMRSAVLGQLSPLYDKQKVPRASLAYFIDATSTTITSLIPITGWAVFFQGIFADFEELKGYGSGFDIYVKTIPYNFYAIAALLVCFGFTMGWVPKLGGMKKAYILAKEEGILYSDESAKLNPPVEHNRNVDSVDKKGLGILIFGIMLLTAVTIASEVLYGFIVCLMVLPVVLLLVKKSHMERTYGNFNARGKKHCRDGCNLFLCILF